jgi:hypothetical protein
MGRTFKRREVRRPAGWKKNLVTTLSGRKAFVLIVFATPEVACSFSTILVPGSQRKRSI